MADAEKFGLVLLDNVKARFFEEGTNLAPLNKVNVRALVQGKADAAASWQAFPALGVAEKKTLPSASASAGQDVHGGAFRSRGCPVTS